jgi:hypothetical protein
MVSVELALAPLLRGTGSESLGEPIAWTLLVVAAIAVLVSACQLFGLPGAPVSAPSSLVVPRTFAVRASTVAPQFVAGGHRDRVPIDLMLGGTLTLPCT